MTDVTIDQDLLKQIAARLELRDPNQQAIESVAAMTSMHYDVDGKEGPFECIVDSATGVGKTYVMAGLIDYFAGLETPARNFLLLAPGRTIRDKSVKNFTPGNSKSLTAAMKAAPYVVTKDNFKQSSTLTAMKDPSRTKLYIFTVQALTQKDEKSGGRETHEYQETLSGSFYEFLANLNDLVVLADEHHCYRGKAFARTINELHPELVVGLTATPAPADGDMVVYRYPLARAITDRLVKTPVLVARKDDRIDDHTKLLDGVTLLRYKERLAHARCDEEGIPRINPVMLVIAQDTSEADRYRDMLDSEAFDGGAWVGRTLVVHSNLTGDEKENALAALDEVEDPNSPVRIIISVGMLKEGWDVKNVYVIASMRVSVSTVLTEQTLGRGMRLPFGQYTGIEMLDTLEVLAHERYEALLAKRHALNERFIDHAVLAELRRTAEGKLIARKRVIEEDADIFPADGQGDEPPTVPTGELTNTGGDSARSEAPKGGLADIEDTLAKAKAAAAETESKPRKHYPVIGRTQIAIPYTTKVASKVAVSLNQIHDEQPFIALGRALTTEADTELRRTLLKPDETGTIRGVQAEGTVRALALDIPLESSRDALLKAIMRVPKVRPDAGEVRAAQRLVNLVIDGMGDAAQEHLSAFGERAVRRLGSLVTEQLKVVASNDVVFSDEVQFAPLAKERVSTREHLDGHSEPHSKAIAFDGWKKCLYKYAWFDTSPEYKAAQALDDAPNVIVWARLHINDLPITWTQEGRTYNPDLVAIEEIDGQRTSWLIETKMNKEATAEDVRQKMKAAKTWANTVNNSGMVDGRWHYILLTEDDVNDAGLDWDQMKAFGTR
ncbi:DEAD/DEAH box helicase family protein [Pseudarthrobacter equi]|uniref:DEAD/DEAH box helicase n=1 Tax=Pseudarthrobacter TaxID=1742993 RepID=UPI001584B959|nr:MULTISPECIES: DEAD/DEAH box helicase family protein [Pseudarthrobacter]MCT9625966.1 DEAD/DEAH box helicase family protein [Pseudarthrobacter equi]NUT72098.1 DEAD/DEAH box helicase family protein [Pseudarthrobacter sp. C4D7]